jgi:hypothetical protein
MRLENDTMETLKLVIKHCVTQGHESDCPFSYYSEYGDVYKCYFNNYKFIPVSYDITGHEVTVSPPDWCPLRDRDIKVELGESEETNV